VYCCCCSVLLPFVAAVPCEPSAYSASQPSSPKL
jgi:hypothetical protein